MRHHEWKDCPTEELIAFVKKIKRLKSWGAKTIDAPACHDPLMKLWQEHAAQVIKEHYDYESDKWTLWGSVLTHNAPKDDSGEWVQGLRPFGKGAHLHGWDSPALIHYLQVADGGEFVVERDGEMIEYDPRAGTGIVVGGKEYHGVRPVKGGGERIALIAAGIENPRG